MSDWHQHLLRSDFSTFIGKTLSTVDPGAYYHPNWHIELIAEYLEAVRHKQIRRLIINMPPRSLKSICVSVAWPAWLLGTDPRSRILVASYASSLSIKHSIDCRYTMSSSWYREAFPKVRIASDQNEKHKFLTTQRGYRLASSVGGSITGEGGNFLIIDDPLNPTQALNAIWRDTGNRWFDHTFASRLDDKEYGAIILVMQRLHPKDLTGYLLAKGGWEHLCLPAVASRHTIHRIGNMDKERKIAELLHPERESTSLIERAKIELGSAAFASQYQQAPVSEDSAMLRMHRIRRYNNPAVFDRIVQSWDTGIKTGVKNDFSACLTFGECAGQSYLLQANLYKCEYPDLKKYFYSQAEEFKPDAILIEDKASGQQLLQDIRRESALPIIAIKPKYDKVTRFVAITAMIEAGRLVLPEQASWLADFEQELFAFPNAEHDDQVDALSQYLDWVRRSIWGRLRIRCL